MKRIIIIVLVCLLLNGCGKTLTENVDKQDICYHGIIMEVPTDWKEEKISEFEGSIIYSNINDSFNVYDESYELYLEYCQDNDYDMTIQNEKERLEEYGVTKGIKEYEIDGRKIFIYEHDENGVHVDECYIDMSGIAIRLNVCSGKSMIDICHSCIESIHFEDTE